MLARLPRQLVSQLIILRARKGIARRAFGAVIRARDGDSGLAQRTAAVGDGVDVTEARFVHHRAPGFAVGDLPSGVLNIAVARRAGLIETADGIVAVVVRVVISVQSS